jgi:hypothetical protein
VSEFSFEGQLKGNLLSDPSSPSAVRDDTDCHSERRLRAGRAGFGGILVSEISFEGQLKGNLLSDPSSLSAVRDDKVGGILGHRFPIEGQLKGNLLSDPSSPSTVRDDPDCHSERRPGAMRAGCGGILGHKFPTGGKLKIISPRIPPAYWLFGMTPIVIPNEDCERGEQAAEESLVTCFSPVVS